MNIDEKEAKRAPSDAKRMVKRLFELAVATAAALMSLLLLYVGARSASTQLELLRHGVRTTAVVTGRELDPSLALSDMSSTDLVIRFEVSPGELVEEKVSAAGDDETIENGAEVRVIYPTGQPEKVRLLPLEWAGVVGIIAVGGLMLLLSGGAVFLESRDWLAERRKSFSWLEPRG